MEMLKAEAVVRLSDPAGVREALFEHFREFVTFTREGEKVSYSSEFGDGYLAAEGSNLRVGIACTEAGTLAMYKDYLAEHVLEFSNESPQFVWTGYGAGEAGIPNFRVVRVVSAYFVTPRMRRVRFSGANIEKLISGGLHVRLLLPLPGKAPVWPHLAPNGRIAWPAGEEKLPSRVYTVRSIDPVSGEIDIDFVMHEGDSMPGAAWGAQALPGDVLGMLDGTGGNVHPYDRYIFCGDETALPVIARLVEEMPAGKRVSVFVEIEDAAEEQVITSKADLDWHWLHRNGRPVGTTGLLETAMRAYDWTGAETGTQFFAGCEKREAKALRAFAINERGLSRADVRAGAYWQKGASADEAEH